MKLSIEILHDYPIALEAVRDWFSKKMMESMDQDGVSQDFKEYMINQGVADQSLSIMLDQSPRSFFDVLDENKIFVEIRLSPYAEGGFFYIINGVEDNQIYDGRIPCERSAVVKGLQLLN
jgi:hypothetical protein